MKPAFLTAPPRWRLAVAIGWTAAVLAMLWAPPPPPPDVIIPHFDKYVHFAFFLGIGLAWRTAGLRPAWVLGAGTVLGAITEIVQASLPWPRSADAWDVVADALGLVVALGIGAVLGAVASRIRRGGIARRGAFDGRPTLGP
ncbi:MAG: hypothetical protein JNK45_23580 [Myxococcales bacterium]|nr:hypothetical protein [Myxococcales bacterium]